MAGHERTYVDFDLEIGLGEGGRLRAQVVDSPAGQAEHDFAMPIDALELENFVLRVGRTRTGVRRVGSPQYRLAKEVGTKLYDALFAGEVRIAFRRSIDRARDQDKGLRIRLRVDEVPALGQVPWEYLYSPGVGDFLVLSSLTPLVRHLDLPMRDETLGIDPPLRVLVVVASPSDLEPLDTSREVELVRRAVGDLSARGSVVVEAIQGATLQDLRRTLRRGAYHVLHFVGHGGYDEHHADGVLAFEDEHGRSRHISGSQLGTVLHDHRSLRLVVLNACEGARTSADDPFSGVAQSLLRRGVPAVVAMQFEITDEAAIAFSHELYLSIVEGEPVESAVAEARLEIFASDNDIEWGTPVLYSRALDGRLFDVADHVAEDAPPVLPPSELSLPPPPSQEREPAPAATQEPHTAPTRDADAAPTRDAQAAPTRDTDTAPMQEAQTAPTARIPRVDPATTPTPPTAGVTGGGRPEDPQDDEPPRAPRRGRWMAVGAGGMLTVLALFGIYLNSEIEVDTEFAALPLAGEPAVDGRGDEYDDDAPSYTADTVVAGADADAGDLAVTAATLGWDDEAFRVLAEITDPELASPYVHEPSRLFRGDSFHFEIGIDNSDLGPDDPLRPHDLHVLVGPAVAGGAVDGVVHAVNPSNGAVFVTDAGADAGLGFAVEATPTGYRAEVAVPWDVLAVDPEPGLVLALNLNASDVEGDELRAMISTNPERDGTSQNHPGRWQAVTLVDPAAGNP